MVQERLFMTIRSSFFVLISHQVITLTCDHSYLRLLMLNNGTKKKIYYYYKLVFQYYKPHSDNIIPSDFKITSENLHKMHPKMKI